METTIMKNILFILLALSFSAQAQIRITQGFGSPLPSPAVQADSSTFSAVTDNSITFSITRGEGIACLIIVSPVAVTTAPSFNTTYTASTVYGSGTALGSGYAVYNGASYPATVTVTGLTQNTVYYFQAYEYNGSAGLEKYNLTTAYTNPSSQATTNPPVAPTTQTTNIVWVGDHTINFTRGNGAFILVSMRSGSALSADPSDLTTYTGSLTYGSGTALGGGYVMYVGTAAGFNIDEFSISNGTYYLRAYEFNGSGGSQKYKTSTATGNGISNTLARSSWYLYHDTPMIPRKDDPGYKTSLITGQTFPIHLFTFNSTPYYWAWIQGAGHSYTLGSDDRGYAMRKLKADGLPINQGWTYVDVGADGEPDIIMERSGSSGNLTLGHVTDLGSGHNPRYLVYYGENYPTASNASQFCFARSNDFITWTNRSVILAGNKNTQNYFFSSATKVGGTTHFLLTGYNQSYPAGEGRLYTVDYFTSTNDTTLTLVKRDVLTGLGTGIDGLGSISDFWIDGGGRINFVASVGHVGPYPGHTDNTGTNIQTTANYRSAGVKKYSFASFSSSPPYLISFQDDGTLYKTNQKVDLYNLSHCPILTDTAGFQFTWIWHYRWRSQWNLPATAEEFVGGKMLTTKSSSTNAIAVTRGTDVLPADISAFYRADQPTQGSVSPVEVLTGTAGTVVGSPSRIQMAGLFPNSGANYVEFSAPSLITDTKYWAIKTAFYYVTSSTDQYGIVSWKDSTGTTGFEIRLFQTRIETTVYGSGGNKKVYRTASSIGPTLAGGIDQTLYYNVGIIWANGTLSLCFDYLNNVSVTKITDNTFTDIAVPSVAKLRIGSVPNTTNPYTKYFVKDVIVWNGISNATFANWLKEELF